ncbi:inosine-5'-monophosphate dehydrogenase [Cutibacterium acnes JCM 18918]|nr:inosine-5'-monophosphate dehydrogenase [Cutibacterium acnes JCM 18918]
MSAEHVANGDDVLDLRKFIYDLDVPVIVGAAPPTRQPCISCAPVLLASSWVSVGERPIPPPGAGHSGVDGICDRRRR